MYIAYHPLSDDADKSYEDSPTPDAYYGEYGRLIHEPLGEGKHSGPVRFSDVDNLLCARSVENDCRVCYHLAANAP